MAEWFPMIDTAARGDEEARFLTRLRANAAQWPASLTKPDDTEATARLEPLVLTVDIDQIPAVPGTAPSLNVLQLAFYVYPTGLALEGSWGSRYLLHDFDPSDPDCLVVRGVPVEPEQMADWAAIWLRTQLSRPLIREEWVKGNNVTFCRWVLEDSGKVLAAHGGKRFSSHKEADRVKVLRGLTNSPSYHAAQAAPSFDVAVDEPVGQEH